MRARAATWVCPPSGFTQYGVERVTDVVQKNAFAGLDQASCFKHGLRRLFFAQMAHHHGAQVVGGFGQSLARGAGLEYHAALAAQRCGQFLRALLLQHDEAVRQRQRLLRAGIGGDVAVEVGAGERQHQGLVRMRLRPGGHGGGRAAGVQREQDVRAVVGGFRIGPVLGQPDRIMPAKQVSPAARGLPVAVVGVGQSRGDDTQRRFFHGFNSV